MVSSLVQTFIYRISERNPNFGVYPPRVVRVTKELQQEKQLAQGLDVVRDLAIQLRKVLVCYGHFDEGHATRKNLEEALFNKVSNYCDRHESLHLEITPHGLILGTQPVYQATSKEDAIAYALFIDGVEALTFQKGLKLDELKRFCGIWSQALRGEMGPTHNILTEVWEAELSHIQLKAKPHFDLVYHADGQTLKEMAELQEMMQISAHVV